MGHCIFFLLTVAWFALHIAAAAVTIDVGHLHHVEGTGFSTVIVLDCATIADGVILANVTASVSLSNCRITTSEVAAVSITGGLSNGAVVAITNSVISSTFSSSIAGTQIPAAIEVGGNGSLTDGCGIVLSNTSISVVSNATSTLNTAFLVHPPTVVGSKVKIQMTNETKMDIRCTNAETSQCDAVHFGENLTVGDSFSLLIDGQTNIDSQSDVSASTAIAVSNSSVFGDYATFSFSAVRATVSSVSNTFAFALNSNVTFGQGANFTLTNECNFRASATAHKSSSVFVGADLGHGASFSVDDSTMRGSAGTFGAALAFVGAVLQPSTTLSILNSRVLFLAAKNDTTPPSDDPWRNAGIFFDHRCKITSARIEIQGTLIKALAATLPAADAAFAVLPSQFFLPSGNAQQNTKSRVLFSEVELEGCMVVTPFEIAGGAASSVVSAEAASVCLYRVVWDGTVQVVDVPSQLTQSCRAVVNVTAFAAEQHLLADNSSQNQAMSSEVSGGSSAGRNHDQGTITIPCDLVKRGVEFTNVTSSILISGCSIEGLKEGAVLFSTGLADGVSVTLRGVNVTALFPATPLVYVGAITLQSTIGSGSTLVLESTTVHVSASRTGVSGVLIADAETGDGFTLSVRQNSTVIVNSSASSANGVFARRVVFGAKATVEIADSRVSVTTAGQTARTVHFRWTTAGEAFALALTRTAIRARGSGKVNALKMSSVAAASRSSVLISNSSLSAEGGLPIETVGLLNTVEFGAEHSMSILQSSIVAQLNVELLTSSNTWAVGLSFKHQIGVNSTLHISEGSTVSASVFNTSSSMSTSSSSFQVPIDGATLDAFAVAFQEGAAFGVGFHCAITDTTLTALSPNRSFAFIAENTKFPSSNFELTRTNVSFAVDANTASAGGLGFVGTTAFTPASLEIVDCGISAQKIRDDESPTSASDAAHFVLWPTTMSSGSSVPDSRQVLQNVRLEGFDLMSSPFKVSDNATGAPAAIGSSVTLCAQGVTSDAASGRAIEFPSELPRRCRAIIDVSKEAEPLAKSAVLHIDCARIKYGVTLANITQDVMVSHCVINTVNEPAIIFANGINPYIFAAIENCTVTSTFVGSAVSGVSPVTVQVLGEMGSAAELIFPQSSIKLESDWENAAAIRMNVAADRRFLFAIQQASITSSCSSNCFGIDIESGARFDLLSSFIFDRTSVVVTTRSAPSASALSIGIAEISERSRIVIKDSTFEATAPINAFALRSQFGLSLGDQFSLAVQGSTLTSIAGRGATTVSFTGVNMNSSSSITFESSSVTANASEWTAIAIRLAPGLNRTASQFAFTLTNCTVEANGGERTAAGVMVGRVSFEDRSSIRIVGSTVMAAASVAANAVTFANTVFHDSTIDVDQSFLGFKTKMNDATLPCGALTFTRAACAFDNTSLRIIDSSLSANPTYIVDGSSSQSTDSSFIMWPGTIASTSIASTSRQLLRNVQLIGLDKVAVPLNINNGNADRNANVSAFSPLCLRNVTTDGTTEAAVQAMFFTETCQRFINVTEMAKDRKPKPPSNTPDALRRSVRTMKFIMTPESFDQRRPSNRATRVASGHSAEEMSRRELSSDARPAHVLATPPLTSAPPTPKPKPTAKPKATPSPTPTPKLAPEKPKDKKPSGKKPQTKPTINEQPNKAIMPMPRYPFPMPRLPTPSTGDESPDFALSIPCDSFLSDDYVGVRLFDVTENVTIQNCDLTIDKFEALRVIGGLKAKAVEVSIIACTFRSVGADAVIRFNGGDFEDNTGVLLINTTIIAEDLAFAAIYLESATTGDAFSFGLENTTISAACERSCTAVKWSGVTVGPGSLLEITKQSSLTTRSTTSTSAAVQLVRVTFGPRGFFVIDEGSTLVSEGVVAHALQMTLSSTFDDSCEVVIRDSNLTSSSWIDTAIRAETVSITNSQFGSNCTFAAERSVVIARSKKSASGIILSRGGTVTSDGFGFLIKDSVVSSAANESNAVAVTLDLDLTDRAEILIDNSSVSSEVSFGGGATAFWAKHVRWSDCSVSVLHSTISFSAAESRPDPLTVQNAGLVWSPPSTFHNTQLVIEDSSFQFRPRLGQHQQQGSSGTEGAAHERVNGSFVQWPVNITGTSPQVFKNVVFSETVDASTGSPPAERTRSSSFAASLKVPAGGDVTGASVCFHRVFFESAMAESVPQRSSAKTRDDPASPQQRTTSTPGNYSVAVFPSQFRPSNECEPTRTQTPTPTLSGNKTSSVTASVSKTLELPTPAPPTLRPAAVPAPAKDAANVAGGVASSVGGVVSPLTAVVAVRGAVMARASDCEAAAAPMPNWPALAAPLSGMFPTDSWGVMGGDIGAVLGNGLVLVIPVVLMLLVGEVVHLTTRRSIFESAAFVLKYGSDVLVTLTVALISPSVGASVAILAVAALGRPDLPVPGGSVTFAAIAVIFILVVCVLAVVLLLWGWRKAVNFESSRNSIDSFNADNDDPTLTSHDQELAGKNITDIADILEEEDSSEDVNGTRHVVAKGKSSPKRRIMSAKHVMTVALSSGEWRANENLSTIEASVFHLWLAIVGDGRVPSNAQHVNTTTGSHQTDQSDDLLDFDMDLINGPRSQPLVVVPLGGGAAPSRHGDGFQGRLDQCLAPWRFLWSYGGWWIALVELTVSVLHGVASGLARVGHCTAGPWLALATQTVYVGILLTVPLAPVALWVVLFGVQFLQLLALALGFFELGEGASNAIGDTADIIDVSLPFVMLFVPVIVAAARILRCTKKRQAERQAARRQAATTLEQPLFDLDFEDEMLSVEDLLPPKRRSEQEVKTQHQTQQAKSEHADRQNPRNQIRIDPLSASLQRQQQHHPHQQDHRQDNKSMAMHGVPQQQQQPPKPRVRMSPLTLPRAIDIETYPPPPPRPVVPPTPILSFSSASRQLSPTIAGARSSFSSPAPPSQLLSTQPSLAPSVNSSLPDRPDNASVDTCAPDDDRCGERRRRTKPSSSVSSSMKERSPVSPSRIRCDGGAAGVVSSAAGASSMLLLSPTRNSNSDSIADAIRSHQDVTDKSSSAGRSTPYSCSSFSLGAGSDLTLPPAPHRVRAYDSFSSAGESVNGRMTTQRSKRAGVGNGSRGLKGDSVDDAASMSTIDDSKSTSGLLRHDPYLMNAVPQRTGLGGHRVQAPQRWSIESSAESAPPPARREEEFLI